MNTGCRHQKKKKIYAPHWACHCQTGQIVVYWCPSCGSIGRKGVYERYATWEKPQKG